MTSLRSARAGPVLHIRMPSRGQSVAFPGEEGAPALEKPQNRAPHSHGVLLYYCIAAIGDVEGMCQRIRQNAEEQRLVGRIRVSPQGLNATVAGEWSSLEFHMAFLSADARFRSTDFKLGPCEWPPQPELARECGFQSVNVRAVQVRTLAMQFSLKFTKLVRPHLCQATQARQELVTLGGGRTASLGLAGPHLSPHQFHSLLLRAQASGPALPSRHHCTSHSCTRTQGTEDLCTEGHCTEGHCTESQDAEREGTGHRCGASRCMESQDTEGRATESQGPESHCTGNHGNETHCTGNHWLPKHSIQNHREGVKLNSQVEADGEVSIGLEKQKEPGPVVVLDARNVYETRIGRFVPPPGVAVLSPWTRQFSDLPKWIDAHEEELKGRTILMYCTGGVRCEGASAYIRSKGPGFERTFQLLGGIVRYLEAFPSGGFFQGTNFVFDHRLSVAPSLRPGSEERRVLGRCLHCERPCEDYSARARCKECRMLVLLCSNCRNSPASCELCSQRQAKDEAPA